VIHFRECRRGELSLKSKMANERQKRGEMREIMLLR
jgi:hypothetical protein